MTDKKTDALAEQPAQQRPQNCGTGFCSCIECPYVQTAQQEPVAWMYDAKFSDVEVIRDWVSISHPSAVVLPDGGAYNIRPLYAAPQPSKPWVGLTQEDRYKAIRPLYCDDATAALAACHSNDEYEAIEARLKEKNT